MQQLLLCILSSKGEKKCKMPPSYNPVWVTQTSINEEERQVLCCGVYIIHGAGAQSKGGLEGLTKGSKENMTCNLKKS